VLFTLAIAVYKISRVARAIKSQLLSNCVFDCSTMHTTYAT